MRRTLQDLFGIDIPIVLAPMGGAITPELCAAVSNAGGLGQLQMWRAEPAMIAGQLSALKALTARPFGVNLNNNYPQDEHLAAVIDAGAEIVSFFWGLAPARVSRAKSAGLIVMQTIGTAEEARQAVDAGVDVVVAQGWEAGGHVWGRIATLPLVPTVVDAVPATPVIAAGGIADGRGLAAVLALGAAGAWVGTRFLAASEARGAQANAASLITASELDTTLGKDPNETWRDAGIRWLGRPDSAWSYDYWTIGSQLAGQSVGLVRKQQPAAEIVAEMWADAKSAVRSLSDL